MKNEDKIIANVYETYDYAKFKKMPLNRDVKNDRLQKLIASFSIKSILAPITVNKKFEIGDGQGRYDARKFLGLPIQYVIDPNVDIDDCRRMNRYNTPWTLYDFCKSYAEGGNYNYSRLLTICDEHDIGISRALRLANKSGNYGYNKGRLTTGNINFTSEDMNTVRTVMELVTELREKLCATKRLPECFYIACSVMLKTDGFNVSRLISNAEKCRQTFASMSNLEDMLKEMSRIYNKYGKSSERLYFEDYMRNKGANVKTYVGDSFPTPREKNNAPDVSTLKRIKK